MTAEIPDSLPALLQSIMIELQNKHGIWFYIKFVYRLPGLVARAALALLAVSRSGLLESERVALLAAFSAYGHSTLLLQFICTTEQGCILFTFSPSP